MTIFSERSGDLVAYFANGDQQKLFLDGVLMRPKVTILTDFPSKNDYALDELDFGKVNVEKNRTIHVYLSNETDVTAKWMLNYVKFPKKSTIGHNTTTPWEVENMEKTDDPEVFEFSVTSVSTSFTLIILCRVHLRARACLLERCQKDSWSLQFQGTKKRRSICLKLFISSSSQKQILFIRANLGL